MVINLGRNQLCWCGSGKKYKFCHWGREKETTLKTHEITKKFNRVWENKYCIHPEANTKLCRGGIVKAHTIQKTRSLERIARNGHVMNFRPDFSMKSGRCLVPQLIGINDASTFTGFCNYHDTLTFRPIENSPFVSGQESCFLVGYRALCREIFLKRNEKLVDFLKQLDKGKSLHEQIIQQKIANQFDYENKAGLRVLERYKGNYDGCLLKKDFSEIKFYVVRLNCIPEVMSCGGMFPEVDFLGNVIQDMNDLTLKYDLMTFSIFSTETSGAIVFAWLAEENQGCTNFVKSIHSLGNDAIPDAIVRFAFEFSENTYFSPNWWDSLNEKEKNQIAERANTTGDIDNPHYQDCLLDDGYEMVNWDINSIETNVSFS